MDLRAPTCQLQQSKAGPTVWENVFIFPKCLTIKKSNRGVLPIDSYILHFTHVFLLYAHTTQEPKSHHFTDRETGSEGSEIFTISGQSLKPRWSVSESPTCGNAAAPHPFCARYSNQVSPPTFQTRGASEKHTLSLTTHILVWQRIVRSPTAKINFPKH